PGPHPGAERIAGPAAAAGRPGGLRARLPGRRRGRAASGHRARRIALANVITRSLPVRAEVAREHTWDAESVFASEEEWRAECDRVSAGLPDLAEFKGHLGAGPDQVADYFQAAEAALRSMGRIQVY